MSSVKLPWLKIGSSALALACYLSLYGPWFILAQTEMERGLMEGYWRLSALLALAYLTARLGHERLERLPASTRYRLTLVWGLVGVALTVGGVVRPLAAEAHFAGWLFLGLGAWLRGLHLGIYPPDNVDMQRQLVLGALGLALALLSAHLMGYWQPVVTGAAPFLLFWLVGALVTTGLMHLEELGERGDDHSSAVARFWPPLLLGLASIMLVLAVLFSWMAPLLMQLLRWPVRLLWYGVRTALGVVAYGLGYVVQVMVWLVRLLLVREEGVEFEAPTAFEPGEMVINGEVEGVSPLIMETLKWMGLAAVVLAALALSMYLLLRAWRRQKQAPLAEVRESYASLSRLRTWGAGRWQEWLGEWEKRRQAWRRRTASPASAVAIYHALLQLAAQRRCPRPPACTPRQFQSRLRTCFPGNEEQVDEFSTAFMGEYYGDKPLSGQNTRELVRSWREFRRQVMARKGDPEEKTKDCDN